MNEGNHFISSTSFTQAKLDSTADVEENEAIIYHFSECKLKVTNKLVEKLKITPHQTKTYIKGKK